MLHQLIEFLERPFVEQQLQPLANRQLTLFVLPFPSLRTTALFRGGMTPVELFETIHETQA